MKPNAVERELCIIVNDFVRLTRSFRALAAELHKKRESDSLCITRDDVVDALSSMGEDEGA